MTSLPRSLRRNIVRDLVWLSNLFKHGWERPLLAIVLLAILALLVWFVEWIVSEGGTGFTFQTGGTQQTRTLWDWLGLLLVPAVLVASGVVFNLILSRRTEAEATTDRAIADERSREQNLRNFINTMQDLIALPSSELDSNERLKQVARAQAIATATTLDSRRFDKVITFLIDTRLLNYVEEDDLTDDIAFAGGDGGDSGSSAADQDSDEVSVVSGDESNEASAFESIFTFEDADFEGVSWPCAHLQRLNLNSADLDNSDLSRAYMEHTTLRDASLRNTKLENAFLGDADLTGAELDRANFEKAVLENAVLRGASLEGTNFKGADLSGVDFRGAIALTPGQLNLADNLVGVTLPDGTKIPDHLIDEYPPRYVVKRTGSRWTYETRRRYFGR